MATATCVITGCALISGNRCVVGDLFDAGDHFMFVGNMKGGAIAWIELTDNPYRKTLEPLDWLERRGVFLIHKADANLNQQAKDYIA